MPKFSIIIPLHNSAKFCRKCLDSVAFQTFKDYELIVVCDNCKDNSAEVAREYTDKVLITSYGTDGSRNAGLDIATGEWILFLDDDDWWLHEYVLEQLDGKLKTLGDIDVLCFSFIFKGWCYATPRQMNGALWIAVWNKCWKRSFIGNVRFPADVLPADGQFHLSMLHKNPKIEEWDMPMYYYNFLHEGSQSWCGREGVKYE